MLNTAQLQREFMDIDEGSDSEVSFGSASSSSSSSSSSSAEDEDGDDDDIAMLDGGSVRSLPAEMDEEDDASAAFGNVPLAAGLDDGDDAVVPSHNMPLTATLDGENDHLYSSDEPTRPPRASSRQDHAPSIRRLEEKTAGKSSSFVLSIHFVHH